MSDRMPTDEEILEAVKLEFLDGIRDGVFPHTVKSFGDLHAHTDANMLADELVSVRTRAGESWSEFFYPIEDRFTEWLATDEAKRAILAALYADEVAVLERAGWTDARPTGTGGGCTALEAVRDGQTLLATDGDHALVRGRDDEESTGWLVALYDSGGEDIGYGEAESLADALDRAVASR